MKTIITDIKQQLASVCSMVEHILALSGMMRGTLGTTYHRCGKQNCWCADSKEKGHLYTKLMWTDTAGPKTRSVKDEEQKAVGEAIEKYRKFKRLRKNLRNEIQRLDELLAAFERDRSAENREKMGYSKSK